MPFCPQCRDERDPGAPTCPECGTPLVDELSPPEPDALWVSVGEVGQIYEAELIALRLREAGIEARVLEKSFQQIPLPQVRSFEKTQVMVPAARGEEARRILTESSNLPEDGESESEA